MDRVLDKLTIYVYYRDGGRWSKGRRKVVSFEPVEVVAGLVVWNPESEQDAVVIWGRV